MKDIARTAKRAAITVAIGLSLAAVTAGPAAAGTDSQHPLKIGSYPNKSTCQRVGAYYSTVYGAPYSCQANAGKWDLWILRD
jgi:hypothetical protein